MIEKPFHDSRNGNEYRTRSREGNDATKIIILTLAIIDIGAFSAWIGNTFLRNATLNESGQDLDSVSLCKSKALKYEQLGYYISGASQINAVISACSVGIGK
jgi:hypothetical protein